MSGGSLDYAYLKVEEIADSVRERAQTELHDEFAEHLYKVAAALKEMEWMLSCDTSPGDEVVAIKSVLGS